MNAQSDHDGRVFDLVSQECPTCGPGAPQRVVGMRGGRHHRYGLGIESRIVQCGVCRLYFPNPYPVPRDPQKLYADPSKYFEYHNTSDRISDFRGVVRSLQQMSEHPIRALLDVGSGQGEMLAAARAEGVQDVVGLELSEAMIEASREKYGVEVRPELIETHAEVETERYDALVLNAVLEHVRDPNSMVQASRRLLKPGGVLYIDIPNEDHLIARLGAWVTRLQGKPEVYVLSPTFPPFHVFGFNPDSLQTLLAKHGFSVERLETAGALKVPARGGLKDRAIASAATVLALASRPLGMGHNMFVWAR